MKNILKVAIVILVLPLFVQCQNSKQKVDTYRFMTYNIHHGEGMDSIVDIARIGRVILGVNPEVVGLQEVDSVIGRSGNVDIIQLLTDQVNMHAVFGHSILHDGGKYGNGILSKEKPISVNKISLPGADEMRTALIVEFEDYIIVNTHLSLDTEERIKSVDIINETVSKYMKPVILMGDLNDLPESEMMRLLEKHWQLLSDVNQHTFPSVEPDSTLDYIWGYTANDKIYNVEKAQVIEDKIASDHRPLFVDIQF